MRSAAKRDMQQEGLELLWSCMDFLSYPCAHVFANLRQVLVKPYLFVACESKRLHGGKAL